MGKIKEFDSQVFNVLRPEMLKALEALGKKFDMVFSIGRISFSPTRFTAKLEARLVDAQPKSVEDYDKYRKLYGLPKLGTKVSLNGKQFKITGFRVKAIKNKVVITRNGKTFVCPVEVAKQNIV